MSRRISKHLNKIIRQRDVCASKQTCMSLLQLVIHHHSDSTRIYQRWNHFHINRIAGYIQGEYNQFRLREVG